MSNFQLTERLYILNNIGIKFTYLNVLQNVIKTSPKTLITVNIIK